MTQNRHLHPPGSKNSHFAPHPPKIEQNAPPPNFCIKIKRYLQKSSDTFWYRGIFIFSAELSRRDLKPQPLFKKTNVRVFSNYIIIAYLR